VIHTLLFVLSFLVILVGSELFTNSVEWAGEKLGVAEAAVGSLLAAVGTALPETLIPAVALLGNWGDGGAHHAVGTGAIIGAPLMLSTVAPFVMGTALFGYRKRRARDVMEVPYREARRDFNFFLPVFFVAILCGFAHLNQNVRSALALGFIVVYGVYCALMLGIQRSSQARVEHGLYFEQIARGNPLSPRGWLVTIQLLAGTGIILLGAQEFVDSIVNFAAKAHLDPGMLSLVVSPFATELPEKYNSVIWIRRGKDHLAFANISGAMVFQSCIPVALGLIYTQWNLTGVEMAAGGIALASTALLYFNIAKGPLSTRSLMLGGAAYIFFLGAAAILSRF
jgi:cation:H+ antiporter